MKVLLSIKPEFADKIFEGSKKYEFRRAIFKKPAINTVVVYASSPVQKVIGEFEIESILSDDLDSLWQKTQDFAGINKTYFDRYFTNKSQGYAIKIKNVKRYKKAKCLNKEFHVKPPQSFLYLT